MSTKPKVEESTVPEGSTQVTIAEVFGITDKDQNFKGVKITNKTLVPPHILPFVVTAFIKEYLKDCIQRKVVKEDDIERIIDLFLRDIQRQLTSHRAQPQKEGTAPLRFNFE